ncbi:magnesium transporter [Pleurocapsales cyanobacterium LEGE 06147]|nr:magnesium transporter [Pleurocapsales cyanobacterium LEGE 06147]
MTTTTEKEDADPKLNWANSLPYINLTLFIPLSEQQPARKIKAVIEENVVSEDIATKIEQMSIASQVYAFHLMPRETAINVYNQLSIEARQKLLRAFKEQSVVGILTQLSPQERGTLFEKEQASEPETEDYFAKSLFEQVKQRVFWLFALLIANLGTTIAIQSQEDVIQRMAILAAFIPLLIGSGGNVTTQSATVMIRELSQSEFNYCQFLRKIFREAIAGIWIGLLLGVLMVGIALLLKGSLNVAIIVGISLMAITFLSTIFGAVLPLLFKALGFDPAMMSAPLSATIVDVIGVLIYLGIARVML